MNEERAKRKLSAIREAVAGLGIAIRAGLHTGECEVLGDKVSGIAVHIARELDSEAVVRSRMFVDNRESAVHEAGDFLFPRQEGLINDNHILGELDEILSGKAKGRKDEKEITLFKSLGLAVEDLATAHFIYRNALLKGIGTSVEFERRGLSFS